MSTKELTSELLNLALTIQVSGKTVRLRPKRLLDEAAVDKLRLLRAELLATLRDQQAQLVKTLLGPPGREHRAAFKSFAEGRRIFEAPWDLFGEPVLFASDNAELDPQETRPVYRAAELSQLVGLSRAELQRVHEIRKIFGGTIVEGD
ncbi:MAG: hypothetical protein K0U98_05870 [Deltaproteobacteria bacterium]|nr:hypothetical protein [Deltaproteobacteria bacterium]